MPDPPPNSSSITSFQVSMVTVTGTSCDDTHTAGLPPKSCSGVLHSSPSLRPPSPPNIHHNPGLNPGQQESFGRLTLPQSRPYRLILCPAAVHVCHTSSNRDVTMCYLNFTAQDLISRVHCPLSAAFEEKHLVNTRQRWVSKDLIPGLIPEGCKHQSGSSYGPTCLLRFCSCIYKYLRCPSNYPYSESTYCTAGKHRYMQQ